MKKTVLYTEKDGHKIIAGFDKPTVDGAATNKIVLGDGDNPGLIHDTPEYQAVEAKKAEYAEAMKALRAARAAKDFAAYKAALAAMSVRQEELQPLARARDEKVISLRRENAVYFEPRIGEVAMDASEVDTLSQDMQGRAKGTFITLDGATIQDNRGRVYFRKVGSGKTDKKWQRTEICKLGDTVPADAVIEPDEMQWDEIEKDRVSALPAEVKMKERDKAMADAMVAAAAMRSELEIKADPNALTKSQDWYQAEVARIEGLYG